MTNKVSSAKRVLLFHNGRGSQEGLFGDGKNYAQLDYFPVKSLNGNKLYLLTAMLTHNLHHELQMDARPKTSGTTSQRCALWCFEKLGIFRKKVLQRAGRLIRPQGRLTLVMADIEAVKRDILSYMAG